MIHKLHFSIKIKADSSIIWSALWSDASYRDWASVFFEGSYALADDWSEGTRVLFLAPDQSGIYSIIEQHIPNQMIKFKHIGTVVKGIAQAIDEESKKWTGSTEVYSLSKGTDGNTLSVAIDVLDEHLDFMKERFPLALEVVKKNCS